MRFKTTILILTLLLFAACKNRADSGNSNPVLPQSPARSTPVESFADVIAKVAPAVVTVRSERLVRPANPFPFFNDPFFRDFFGFGERRSGPQVERGLGSGVIVTKDGYIITNHHVIDGADEIKIETGNGKTYDAKIIGSDPPSDIAVLKISADDLTVLPLGNSDKVRVGDVALAIGNPLGVGQTVTAGIISAKERATGLGHGTFESFLQTDAPINRGNSGGALINTAGELVGINSQILSTTGGNIGIGFAIPSNMARQVAEQLIKKGAVRRGRLGVTVQPLSTEIARSLNLDSTEGVIVSSVEENGPADRAGIRQGDILTELNGERITDSNQFRNRIAAIAPGTEVTLSVIREGKRQQIRAKLGEVAAEGRRASANPGQGDEQERFGMRLSPLTPDLAAQLGLSRNSQGLVITELDPAGRAARSQLSEGDLIKQVNLQPVRSIADFRNAVERAGNRPVLLLIQRQENTLYVTL